MVIVFTMAMLEARVWCLIASLVVTAHNAVPTPLPRGRFGSAPDSTNSLATWLQNIPIILIH